METSRDWQNTQEASLGKWLVRGLVFIGLGGMAVVAVVYLCWTNPEAVRAKVLAQLEHTFLNVSASVEGAHLRLFGGIEVRELRLARKDDLDRSDFLAVPSATLFHDKEHVLDGQLNLRKVEIRRPRLRLIRERDGHWNVSGLFGPSKLDQRLPALLIRQGTLTIEDRQAAPGTPPLEINDVCLSAVNDPLPVVTFEGSGVIEPAGRVRISGRAPRGGGPLTLTIDAPGLKVGPELVQRLAGYAPDAAVHLRRFSATVNVHAQVTLDAAASTPLSYYVHGELSGGEFAHARLPWPLEKLSGSFSARDGVVPEVRLSAVAGKTEVEATLRNLRLEPGVSWMDRADAVEFRVRHLRVDDSLFDYLPPALQVYKTDYAPDGTVSVHLDLKHCAAGIWQHHNTLEVEEGRGCFHGFRVPVQRIQGKIAWRTTVDLAHPEWTGRADDWLDIDLRGEAGGQPTFLKGRIEGERGHTSVTIDLWGNDMPLDEMTLSALPPKPLHQARNFAPSGCFDYRVFLRRARGEKEVSKRFLFHLHHCQACYKVFPLPLTEVSGTLDIRPDSWEFRDFVGRYKEGTIRASGRSRPMDAAPLGSVARANWNILPGPGVKPSALVQAAARAASNASAARISVAIEGQNLPIDDGFKEALAPDREALAKAVDAFDLTGKLNFSAHIDDLPNQPRDVDVTVKVGGCRIKPIFFPYPIADVAATVRYAKNNVWITGFHGRHGDTVLYVKQGNVVLPPEGGFWAKLDRLQASPLAFDDDLQRALPGALAKVTRVLKFSQPVNLATELVISQPGSSTARPSVYWDSVMALKDTELDTGTTWSKVNGLVSSKGFYNGQQVEDVVGNIFLERASVLGQNLRNVHIPVMVWKGKSDKVSMPDIKADLYGGSLDGQGRLELEPTFRYEMVLHASRIQLEQLGGQNFRSADISGLANATLHLAGEGGELEGLRGHGRLDVPSGKMYRLPLLLDLMKWLGLRLPDRTAFEQAHAKFRIEGPRLHIEELELDGSAISVRGSGGMKLNGDDVKLDLNADWGRLWPLLPPGINTLSREVSHQLLKIKVHGKVGDLKFDQELVPAVTTPLKKMWKGLTPGTSDKATR